MGNAPTGAVVRDERFADRGSIMLRMRGFALSSPLRVLGPHVAGSSNSEFFDREGCALLRDVIASILLLFDPDAPPVSEWLSGGRPESDTSSDGDPSSGRTDSDKPPPPFAFSFSVRKGPPPPDPTDPSEWVQALHAPARGFDGERGVNIVALRRSDRDWYLRPPPPRDDDDDDRLGPESRP